MMMVATFRKPGLAPLPRRVLGALCAAGLLFSLLLGTALALPAWAARQPAAMPAATAGIQGSAPGAAPSASCSAQPHQVLHLSAAAQQQASPDWLRITLHLRAEGADAASVQRQLSQGLEAGLRALRPQVRRGAFEVSSGAFAVQPRHGAHGQVVGWQGSAELLLQGRDFGALNSAAAQARGLSVAHLAFSLSPEARQALEAELSSAAIARFRASAAQAARDFGLSGYTLREVHISAADSHAAPMPRLMLAAAARADAMPEALPTEPGLVWVQVQVSGAVQLH